LHPLGEEEMMVCPQSLAMFIGALCHDLDHRGFNNKFMIDIG